MSAFHVVVALQQQLHNSTLTVYLNGKVIGTILQDAPGKWIATPPQAQLPIHPTLQAAASWLGEQAILAQKSDEP